MKNRYLAAALNFIVWGLGYLYLGKRDVFSFMLVTGSLLSESLIIYPMGVVLPFRYQLITSLSALVIDIAFAYDAYRSA